MIRYPAIGFVLAAVLANAPAVRAQTDCKEGTAATVDGAVGSARQYRREDGGLFWLISPRATIPKCSIEDLMGDGELPSDCSKGRTFRASGEVYFSPQVGFAGGYFLDVRSIPCK